MEMEMERNSSDGGRECAKREVWRRLDRHVLDWSERGETEEREPLTEEKQAEAMAQAGPRNPKKNTGTETQNRFLDR